MQKHIKNRAIFIFCVMFPVLLIAEYLGNNHWVLAGIVGGITSGVSVVLFPDPEHIKKLNKEQNTQQDPKEDSEPK